MKTSSFLDDLRHLIDDKLSLILCNQNADPKLTEAMRYSVLLGGKRVRPILTLATAHAFSCDTTRVLPVACAIELIHAYSLIHDDLPAMDDDSLRRGQATCHIAFDEATAILAGDALQCLAFDILSDAQTEFSEETKIKLIQVLAKASGALGMVAGQAIDLASVGKALSIEALEHMHQHKTGKLIEASVLLGALCGDANTNELHSLAEYSQALGLAFQVQDDILDVIGDTEIIGKSSGADIALDKPTYVSLLGLEQAQVKLQELLDSCMTALGKLEYRNTEQLRHIAEYVVNRNK